MFIALDPVLCWYNPILPTSLMMETPKILSCAHLFSSLRMRAWWMWLVRLLPKETRGQTMLIVTDSYMHWQQDTYTHILQAQKQTYCTHTWMHTQKRTCTHAHKCMHTHNVTYTSEGKGLVAVQQFPLLVVGRSHTVSSQVRSKSYLKRNPQWLV